MRSTRRDFLGISLGTGVAAALSPFVPVLSGRARAQQAGYPTRFVMVFTGCGSVADQYWPSGGETDFQMNKITAALEPHRSKLIFPNRLRRNKTGPGGHESATVCCWTNSSRNSGSPFGGYSANPSVDQIIAKALPKDTTFPSLEFGVQSDGPGANSRLLAVMSYAGSDQPVAAEPSPYKMFDRLMLGSATAPTGLRPEDLERIRVRKKSTLDLVRNELKALSGKIDKYDRLKIDQHVEGLSTIEKRLFSPGEGTVVAPPAACGTEPPKQVMDLKANENFPELLDIQNSLAIAALACNRTRVASLQWSRAFSMLRHTWVNVTTPHHTLSHGGNSGQKAAIETWFMTRMAGFLEKMQAVGEGPGSLLDNTMLIYANELTAGSAHNVSPPITLVAGSGSGKLKTGRLLNLEGYDFSQLLVTACHVMGLTQIQSVGDLGGPKVGPVQPLWA